MKIAQRVAMMAVAISAVSSLALMLRAGRHQKSVILVLVFAAWVLSPFVGLVWANLSSKQWLPFARAIMYGLTLAVVFTCPVIYADVAFGRTTLKMGFVFLVVPFVCLLFIGLLFCIGLLSPCEVSRVVDRSR